MSAYLELRSKDDRLVLIDAGSVAGFICPKGGDTDTEATKDNPFVVILRGGETMPPIFGTCVSDCLLACAYVRTALKQHPLPVVVLKWSDFHQRVQDMKSGVG